MNLAVEALKQDPKLSVRRAAAIYTVPRTTLRDRRAGRPSRVNTMANSRNLTNSEEQVIVEHILELVERGYPLGSQTWPIWPIPCEKSAV